MEKIKMRTSNLSGGIMNITKSKLALAAAAALTLGSAITASAAPTTFAQFHELTTGNPNLFSYTEGTGTATLSALSIPVSFSYTGLVGLPADLQGNQAATLTITTTTNQPAVSLMGMFEDEQFPVLSTLTITRDTPAAEGSGTQTNLLTLNFTGQLLAAPGGNTAQFTGETALGNSVTYSSDFINLTNVLPQNYAISFSSWTSADSGGVEVDPTSGFLNSATAAGVGTFDGSVAVPEPASLSFLALAALPMLKRRRRAAR
jgi:hypothetical protein